MHASRYVIATALCVAVPTLAHAAGTQRIVSHAGTCEMTVPAGWKVDKWIKSSASSADGSISAVVSTAPDSFALAGIKPIIEGTLKPVKVFEDSTSRLWYAYAGGSGKASAWYVGVPGKAGICGAQIAFKHATDAAEARAVALSVKPSA